MQDRPSLDLDVLFTRAGDDYQAQVVRSPTGEGQLVRFPRPFSDLELENLILKVGRFFSLLASTEVVYEVPDPGMTVMP